MSEKDRLQLENELLLNCSKAQAINKYIDELEESSKLSELWCKSRQEINQLKEVMKELREYTNDKLFDDYTYYSYEDLKQNINEILDKVKEY